MTNETLWTFLLVATRWLHSMSAALWVGGGIVYLLVVVPSSLRLHQDRRKSREATWMARQAIRVLGAGIGVFLLTGGILTFQRLAEPQVDLTYGLILILKVAVSLVAFALVWKKGELFTGIRIGPARRFIPGPFRSKAGLAIILGSVAYLLAIILQRIVESELIAR